MSNDLIFTANQQHTAVEYTVRQEDGCTFIFGDLPTSGLVALTGGKSGKGMVMASHLARLAGANIAWGTPQNVDAAVEKYIPIALARVRQDATRNSGMRSLSDEALRWLAVGEHGMSACGIFWKTTGFKPDMLRAAENSTNLQASVSDQAVSLRSTVGDEYPRHPADLDDLGRCRRLLEQVPMVRDRFISAMGDGDAGPVWAALVRHWCNLCAVMDREAPDWRNGKGSAAQKTYRMLQEIVSEAECPRQEK